MSEPDPQRKASTDEMAPADRPALSVGGGTIPTRPARSRAGMFFVGLFSGCLIALLAAGGIVLLGLISSDSADAVLSTNRVAIIPIEGEIVDSREALDLLHKYAESATVRAIVVRIDSPGGAIAPSQEIYEAIRSIRESSGKPVVASLSNVAASGGFYIAAACDRIVSNPGSITGSIGVILEWMEVKDLLAWAKLKPQTITAGSLKATGSPYKDLTDEERAYLTSVVDQLHSQFIRAVAAGRRGKMSLDEVKRIANGRIFTGEQALQLKLVDQLGNLDDAVALAGRMGGVHGTPSTIYPKRHRGGILDLLATGETRSPIEQILARHAPRFLFRW